MTWSISQLDRAFTFAGRPSSARCSVGSELVQRSSMVVSCRSRRTRRLWLALQGKHLCLIIPIAAGGAAVLVCDRCVAPNAGRLAPWPDPEVLAGDIARIERHPALRSGRPNARVDYAGRRPDSRQIDSQRSHDSGKV
jgi:hypothetical protein